MLAQQPRLAAPKRFQCFIVFVLTGETPSTTITEFASSQARHLMHCLMNPKWLWDSRRPLRKGSLQRIIELQTIGCKEPVRLGYVLWGKSLFCTPLKTCVVWDTCMGVCIAWFRIFYQNKRLPYTVFADNSFQIIDVLTHNFSQVISSVIFWTHSDDVVEPLKCMSVSFQRV